jgi:hypothetical protein
MKKFWLSLGLTFMLSCWYGAGNYGLGVGEAFGQDYYTPSLSCNASDPACYGDYYRAPYERDPVSQFLYRVAPPVDRDYRYQRREQRRERRDRNRDYRRGY